MSNPEAVAEPVAPTATTTAAPAEPAAQPVAETAAGVEPENALTKKFTDDERAALKELKVRFNTAQLGCTLN